MWEERSVSLCPVNQSDTSLLCKLLDEIEGTYLNVILIYSTIQSTSIYLYISIWRVTTNWQFTNLAVEMLTPCRFYSVIVISPSLVADPSGDELSEDSGSAGVCQSVALLPRVRCCSVQIEI